MEIRSVVSESLLKSIDPNKSRLPNPDFELVPPEWRLPCNADSTVPATTTIKRGLQDGQENEEPVRQKPKLSLSLKKKMNDRFSKPLSPEELKKAAQGVTPVNTQSSNDWALRNFRAWMEHRNTTAPDDPVPPNLLSCFDAATLCKWLCCYVQETKKENGQAYPASTLRSLLAVLQRMMHANKVPFNIFDKSDMQFRDLHMTLDTVCVSLRKEGIGASVKHADVISLEHEELMWQKGVLGVHSLDSLLRAVFYTVGLHFCLRGGQEHRDLKRSQFTRIPADGYDASTYYQYIENGSKNYQGRFSETGQANKIGRAYAQPNSGDKCPVRVLDLYLKKLPPGSTAFYMQPVQKLPADPYQALFKNTPVGVNPLKNMMTKVSELAGLSVTVFSPGPFSRAAPYAFSLDSLCCGNKIL